MASVLVVDDEAGVRRLACKILKRAGHDVLQAEDGVAARDVVRKLGGALDLVITDIRMPRMTGPELAHLLRSEYPDVKIVLMFAFADSTPLADWDFIRKPFTPAMLLLTAERLIRRSDKHEEASGAFGAGMEGATRMVNRCVVQCVFSGGRYDM